MNWSCAYDSYFTILRYIWYGRDSTFLRSICGDSQILPYAFDLFAAAHADDLPLDSCRLRLRTILWEMDPVGFPKGQLGADLYSLTRAVNGVPPPTDPSNTTHRLCFGCHRRIPGFMFEGIGRYTVMRTTLTRDESVARYLASLERVSGQCDECAGDLMIEHEYPSLMCVELPNLPLATVKKRLIVNSLMELSDCRYRLAGVVYWGGNHFASRVVDHDMRVYAYDGMVNEGKLEYEFTDMCTDHLRSPTVGAACHDELPHLSSESGDLDHPTAAVPPYLSTGLPICLPHKSLPTALRAMNDIGTD